MANKIKFRNGDLDDHYEPSDSENEYTEREKGLLKKVRKNNKKQPESDEEVLAFDDDDEEDENLSDDNDEYLENSDFDDDNENDGIPDARAWGKKRKDFYSTDFVDQDYSEYNAKEEQLAEQEENEARKIQQRLAQQLEEADFTLDVFGGSSTATNDTGKQRFSNEIENDAKIHLKSDLTDMSHREKLQLFKKDSPEFEGLVQDFETRLEESEAILEPILDYFSKKELQNLPIIDFVKTQNNLILTYCSNVAFYLVLKSKRLPIKNHPLVKRLVQLRQLLLQLEDKYTRVIKPQLQKLLQDIKSGNEIMFSDNIAPPTKPVKKQTKLKFLTSMKQSVNSPMDHQDSDEQHDDDDELNNSVDKEITNTDSEEEANEENMDEEDGGGDDDERRQITYQMSKNKGLTPHRKKELRNPRVKHRNKFRKAIIRRKGAVRTVRTEVKRYGGEISGIKASTKKGIKIK